MGSRYHLGLAALVGLLLAAAVGLRLPPALAFVFGAVLAYLALALALARRGIRRTPRRATSPRRCRAASGGR